MKEIKDLYNENYKSLRKSKKILEDGRASQTHEFVQSIP
jgi:hypothetical protein